METLASTMVAVVLPDRFDTLKAALTSGRAASPQDWRHRRLGVTAGSTSLQDRRTADGPCILQWELPLRAGGSEDDQEVG